MKWWKLSFFPSLDGRIQCPQIIHKSCFVVKVKLFHLVISNNEKTTNLIGLKRRIRIFNKSHRRLPSSRIQIPDF
tara:strand:- start:3634 stop:3858 length:225 start_codon:yes stop_codon:yes gene_type:complete